MEQALRMKVASELGKVAVLLAGLEADRVAAVSNTEPVDTAAAAVVADAGVAVTAGAGEVPVLKLGSAGKVVAGHKVAEMGAGLDAAGTRVALAPTDKMTPQELNKVVGEMRNEKSDLASNLKKKLNALKVAPKSGVTNVGALTVQDLLDMLQQVMAAK